MFWSVLVTRKKFRRVCTRLPRLSNSDHRAIVAVFYTEDKEQLTQYRRRRERFPIRLPKWGPRTEHEAMFEALQSNCEPPSPRTIKANHWISEVTWTLIDHRAQLRREGRLTQALTRRLGREVKASLKADRKVRAEKAADAVESHLASGDLKEAWRSLKGWYSEASDRASKPCYESMIKQTQERVKLYTAGPPPGEPIPINVEPYDVN